jgi:hypothetical protein
MRRLPVSNAAVQVPSARSSGPRATCGGRPLTCQDTVLPLNFHAEPPTRRLKLKMRWISFVAAASLAITSPAAIAVAQAPSAARAQQTAAGPTTASRVAGVRRAEAARATPAPAAEARLGAGKNVALMVVGGAALIIGAVIGGTAGVLIAVAGAAIGLYGLYNFVQ